MKLAELLQRLNTELAVAHEAEQIVEWALFHSTGRDWPRSLWMTVPEMEIQSEFAHRAVEMARERRTKQTPLQYLTETQWFYGRKFLVRSGVLVPRPETEILVEVVVDHIKQSAKKNWVGYELGVGAGPIAVSLLAENSHLRMVGTDISPVALDVSLENAKRFLDDPSRLALFRPEEYSDEQYDFIVSNPPYLNQSRDEVDEAVQAHEPRAALFAPENDLLYFYKYLESFAQTHLLPNGFLALEIPHERSYPIQKLFDSKVWKNPKLIQDLNSRDRVLVLELN